MTPSSEHDANFYRAGILTFSVFPKHNKALILGKNDDHYSMMLSKVHGIMFFSTPHKGSPHARTLNSFLSLMVGTSAKVYIQELESSSTSIESITEKFRTICSEWKLISLYESLPTKLVGGMKKLVSNYSSSRKSLINSTLLFLKGS